MTRKRGRKAAATAFRRQMHALSFSGVEVPAPRMSPEELATHLANRTRGGRRTNKRAAAKAGSGRGGRAGARRAACAW